MGEKDFVWKSDGKKEYHADKIEVFRDDENGDKIILKKRIIQPDEDAEEVFVEVFVNPENMPHHEHIVPEIDEKALIEIEFEMQKEEAKFRAVEREMREAEKEMQKADKEMKYRYEYLVSPEVQEIEKTHMMEREEMLKTKEKILEEQMEMLEQELKQVKKEIKAEKKK